MADDLKMPVGIEAENEVRNLKAKLIMDILDLDGMAFRDDMSRDEREAMDVERQSYVMRLGLTQWSLTRLEDTVKMLEGAKAHASD
jgi:hypothetical protein